MSSRRATMAFIKEHGLQKTVRVFHLPMKLTRSEALRFAKRVIEREGVQYVIDAWDYDPRTGIGHAMQRPDRPHEVLPKAV